MSFQTFEETGLVPREAVHSPPTLCNCGRDFKVGDLQKCGASEREHTQVLPYSTSEQGCSYSARGSGLSPPNPYFFGRDFNVGDLQSCGDGGREHTQVLPYGTSEQGCSYSARGKGLSPPNPYFFGRDFKVGDLQKCGDSAREHAQVLPYGTSEQGCNYSARAWGIGFVPREALHSPPNPYFFGHDFNVGDLQSCGDSEREHTQVLPYGIGQDLNPCGKIGEEGSAATLALADLSSTAKRGSLEAVVEGVGNVFAAVI